MRKRLSIFLCVGGRSGFDADGLLDFTGNLYGKPIDGFLFGGFDHDAAELLGSGVSHEDAAVFAQFAFGVADGGGDIRQGSQGRFFDDIDIDEALRGFAEDGCQFGEFASGLFHSREELESRDDTVAGRMLVEEDHVTGLFAAEGSALLLHQLKNETIADTGIQPPDPQLFENETEPEV